jgi:hypothetical protein
VSKNNKSPWKSGYGTILGNLCLLGFILTAGSLTISLNNPESLRDIIMLFLGLEVFCLSAIFGIANWLIEKQVNYDLVKLGFTSPFETESVDLGSKYSDPLVSIKFIDGTRISRNFDQVFTSELVPIAVGVSLYLFYYKGEPEKNFCVVFNQYGLGGLRFKAFERNS